MKTNHKTLLSSLFLTLLLSACGGGGSGGGDPIGNIAGGGIGGTGTGTATGFGSIIINTSSEFAINANTDITINGETASESDLGVGMVVSYNIGDDASADLSSGTAVSIEADSLLTGPVTSVNPLRVLRQDVIITSDTVLANVTGNDPANLAIGDIVEVYGFADNVNTVQASRLELKAGGAPVWELTGVASNVVADTSFSIGNQAAALNGVVPRDCDDGFNNGDLVEVKATAPASFSAGDTLDTVTDVECIAAGLAVPNDPVGGTIPAEVEGFVNSVATPADFVVNGQRILTNAGTRFVDGTVEDLFVGAKVEVEGQFATGTRELTATAVKFKETRVRIEAPLSSADVVAGKSLEILGITVIATALTEDEDGIVASGNVNQQVEVRGFVDSTGTVFATRVRERGNADPNDVRLRGPVSNIVPPLFEILGVTIDAGSATRIFNAAGNTIDMDQFFDLISDGSNVEVEDGQYDGVSRINNGEIEIEN